MSSSQDTTVSDTLAVVKALKKHLKERHCRHTLKSIVKQALENRGVGHHHSSQTPAPQKTILGTNQNDQEYFS